MGSFNQSKWVFAVADPVCTSPQKKKKHKLTMVYFFNFKRDVCLHNPFKSKWTTPVLLKHGFMHTFDDEQYQGTVPLMASISWQKTSPWHPGKLTQQCKSTICRFIFYHSKIDACSLLTGGELSDWSYLQLLVSTSTTRATSAHMAAENHLFPGTLSCLLNCLQGSLAEVGEPCLVICEILAPFRTSKGAKNTTRISSTKKNPSLWIVVNLPNPTCS